MYEHHYDYLRGYCPDCNEEIMKDIVEMEGEKELAPDGKVMIEEWILEMLWDGFPKGAARNQLAVREMSRHIRRWEDE
jgi:hypothetical protein